MGTEQFLPLMVGWGDIYSFTDLIDPVADLRILLCLLPRVKNPF